MSRLGRGFPNNALMRPIPLPFPVSYDATGGGSNVVSSTPSLTWAHNISGNAIIVCVSAQATNTTAAATAKVGTTSMTQLGASAKFGPNSGYYTWSIIFGLLAPPQASQTISLSLGSGAAFLAGNSVSYNNVGSFGTVVSSTGTSSSPALSVSSAPRQMVAETFTTWNTNPTGYTQTSRYSLNAGSPARGFLIGDAPGAATVNFSAVSCDQWAAAAVPLIPV